MSDRAYLPEFVREALEGGAGSTTELPDGEFAISERPASEAGRAESSPDGLSEAELRRVERSLGALLEAAWPDPEVAALGGSAQGSAAQGGATFGGGGSNGGGARGRTEDFLPSAALFERLEQTLSEAPHCYAPFYSRAADLLDLPEASVIDELARLRDPKVWRFAGLPGIHNVAVKGGPRVQSAETLFVRFAPGTRFPKHRHTGLERVLVLEGSYRDSLGVMHHAGELRQWEEGTEHGFVVDKAQPCIFASVVFGRRFNAWPLRALASVLGR